MPIEPSDPPPDPASDFVERARALLARKQYQETARLCRLGLLSAPQRTDGRLVLGMALLRLARHDEVLAEMRVALEAEPRSALGWLLKGEALVEKGDYTQAGVAIQRARELDPLSEHADKLLAEVRAALAAGLSGAARETTQTQEYPARFGGRLRDLADDGPLTPAADLLDAEATPVDLDGGLTPVRELVDPERAADATARVAMPERGAPSGERRRGAEPRSHLVARGATADTSPSVMVDEALLRAARGAADDAEPAGEATARIVAPALEEDGDEAPTREVRMPALRPTDRGASVVTAAPSPSREPPRGSAHRPATVDAAPRDRARAVAGTAEPPRLRPRPLLAFEPVLTPIPADLDAGWALPESPPVARVVVESAWRPRPREPGLLVVSPDPPEDDALNPARSPRPDRSDEELRSWVGGHESAARSRVDESAERRAASRREPVAPPARAAPAPLPAAVAARDEPRRPRSRPRDSRDDEPLLVAGRARESSTEAEPPEELSWSQVELDDELLEEIEEEVAQPSLPARSASSAARRDPPRLGAESPPRAEARRPGRQVAPPRRSPELDEAAAGGRGDGDGDGDDDGDDDDEQDGDESSPPAAVRVELAAPPATVEPLLRRSSRGAAARSREDDAADRQPTHRVDRVAPAPAREAVRSSPSQSSAPLVTEPAVIVEQSPRPREPSPEVPAPSQLSPARPRRRVARATQTVVTRHRSRTPRSAGVLLLVLGALGAVALIAGVTGFLLREYRLRARIERRRESARVRLIAGTDAGFRAAADDYRWILGERPHDELARGALARTLATQAFEFGTAIAPAASAVSSLAEDATEDAQVARTCLALARGELERGERFARELQRGHAGAAARYLEGRLELLRGHAMLASQQIASATELEPRDALLWHGLGVAEAAQGRDEAALAAFARALEVSPSQIASLVDRAALQIERGRELVAAATALEQVTSRLAGEASPIELARAHLAQARLRLRSGELAPARQALARAEATLDATGREAAPGDGALAAELAGLQLQALDVAAAERIARAALGSGKGGGGARLVLARAALLRGRPDEALRELAAAAGDDADGLVLRATAHLAQRQIPAARAEVERALRLAPTLSAAQVARARIDIADGRAGQALRDLQALEPAQREPALVAEAIGDAFWALRQGERARAWYEAAVKRDPLSLTARVGISRALREQGRAEEARAELQRVVQLDPSSLAARGELAGLALAAADPTAARDAYEALLARTPDDVAALLGAARAHLALGDAAVAVERVARAARGGAAGEEVSSLHATALLRAGRAAEAAALLRPLIAAAQRGEIVALYLAATRPAGRSHAPATIARFTPRRLRDDPDLQLASARAFAEAGRSSRAEALALGVLKRADRLRLSPLARAEAYAIVGRAAYDQGALASAARNLEAALRIDPGSARAAYQLAILSDERRAGDAARRLMEQAVRADPGFADALYELARLRGLAHDERAREAYEAYLRLDPRGPYANYARAALRGGR